MSSGLRTSSAACADGLSEDGRKTSSPQGTQTGERKKERNILGRMQASIQ